MEVTSNSSVSSSDGRIRAWQGSNTTPVLDITGKQMIDTDPNLDGDQNPNTNSGAETWMSRLRFEVFMGGKGVAKYSPESDQTISFTDMYIGTGTW